MRVIFPFVLAFLFVTSYLTAASPPIVSLASDDTLRITNLIQQLLAEDPSVRIAAARDLSYMDPLILKEVGASLEKEDLTKKRIALEAFKNAVDERRVSELLKIASSKAEVLDRRVKSVFLLSLISNRNSVVPLFRLLFKSDNNTLSEAVRQALQFMGSGGR